MIRRAMCITAFAALFAAGAHAQAPFQANYQQTSIGTGSPTGFDFGAYTGEFLSPSDPLKTFENNGASFQVWCVDPLHFIAVGEQSTPWVTYLSGSDYSHTLVGSQTKYLEAAFLAQSLFGATINSGDENLEYAMWELLGYTTVNDVNCAGGLITACPNYNAGTVATNVANAIAGYSSLTFNQWSVITNPINGNFEQEMLYFHQEGPPEEVVPEPATMSLVAMGLVGLAGVSFKRRKRRS